MTDPTDQLRAGAAAVQRGDFAAALPGLQAGLTAAPDDPALLGLAALSALRLGQQDLAVLYLRRQLIAVPDDRAARYNLATTLAGRGQVEEAATLAADYAGHAKLARLAGYLAQQHGQLDAAIPAYNEALRLAADDWESWNNLGNCYSQSGDDGQAIVAFEQAINRAPGQGLPELFLNLSQALGTVSNREARLRTAAEAARRYPRHPSVQIEHGLALIGAGRNAEAIAVLEAAAKAETGFGEAHLELGLIYEHANQLDALDALISAGERMAATPAWSFLKAWSLRRSGQFEAAAVLAAEVPDIINPVRTAQLRAEIADRLGDADEAFRQFSAMNRASAQATHPSGPLSYRAVIEAQTAALAPPPGPAIAEVAPAPIFVVGFPRSGTTLLDTLLSALPELQVFEELPLLAGVEAEFPGLASSTDAAQIEAARAHYRKLATEAEGPAAGRRIVDKHPLHMTKLPLINRLFPSAQIVLVERHPCDVVLSCFMANFQLNTAMRSFTDLEEAARTYDAVFTNWSRARKLLPLANHAVRYERMVADLEAEMRPLLNFLGLEWRPEVLDNQASAARRGTVRTASYAQIGQPLYQRAVGRWERYRTQLEPVLPILEPWIDQMGYQ